MEPFSPWIGAASALFVVAVLAAYMDALEQPTWEQVLALGAIFVSTAGLLVTFDWRIIPIGVVGTVLYVFVDEDDGESLGSDDNDEHVTDAEDLVESDPGRDFDDVGGMNDLKATLRERVIRPLRSPGQYQRYGLGATDGVLLYGPPGCGKTYMAGAVAGELGFNFIEVGPTDFASKWVGQAPQNVENVFEAAREHSPCIVFIDEIDAVAGDRSSDMTNSEQQMVNQLLTELQSDNDDVVVIGATNYLDDIDDAILRSGRFDERIEVPPPDPAAREEIFALHLPDRKTTDGIDLDAAVTATEGYASSDVELVAELAARHAMAAGDPVDSGHVAAAIEETTTSLTGWLHRYDHIGLGEDSSVAQPDGTNLPAAEVVESDLATTFDDVPGMNDQKRALVERLIEPLANPDAYADHDVDVVDGVVLYGPPGCGKAALTRALAGELGLPLIELGPETLVERDDADPGEVVDELCAIARANAPSVLHVEALETLAPTDARQATLGHHLASALRAIESADVVVVGTTSDLTSVENEVLATGVFDDRIEVPAPDRDTRQAVLEAWIDADVVADHFDWGRGARVLDGYALTDIETIAEQVARTAVRTDDPATVGDVERVAEEIGSSLGESVEQPGLSYIN
ncbi:AAA family ATPase [Halococcoides cellulosivorans]|uniref:AAA+ ATPase domain-containing protein n=1 Tax=Halococcoides cellulosivorans TaxID=1679096 RepID=A0A2R4X255_9EURY|nr:ATP-binding protein [Halococcoides cellulosivorans]AWB27868.1 hypothetical protein HARCEL1_09155 [Halococcoides cellulosivorans]